MKAVLESILVKALEDIRDCSKLPTYIFCLFLLGKKPFPLSSACHWSLVEQREDWAELTLYEWDRVTQMFHVMTHIFFHF